MRVVPTPGKRLQKVEEYLVKSPFPGMDPFIEVSGLWEDFHTHLVEKIYESLADAAPEHYLVRSGERFYVVLVEEEEKTSYPFVPDIGITDEERRTKRKRKSGRTAVLKPAPGIEPISMRAFIEEEHREVFVEIYEARAQQRLVTCIEVLSPSNKRSNTPGWDVYQRKRQSLLLEGVNLVEIDFLRAGQRMPMLDPWPDCEYTLLVARANKGHRCQVWPIPLACPLPTIPVPLAKPDRDLPLALQGMVEGIYKRSRYSHSIDYTRPLVPPLSSQANTWLEQRLKATRRVR
jgi:hypothetical protein